MKRVLLFVLVLTGIPFLLYVAIHYKQITYFVEQKYTDRKPHCSVIEKYLVADEIIYSIDCPYLAYLSDLIIDEGQAAELNLFGHGILHVAINKIKTDILDKKQNIANFSISVNKNTPSLFSNKFGFSASDPTVVKLDTENLASGWYEVLISDNNSKFYNLMLFIEPTNLKNILFVESTDTLIAYNKSYYTTRIPNNYNRSVSQKRDAAALFPKLAPIEYNVNESSIFPIRCSDHLINADIVLKQFLNENGVNFTSISDERLDFADTYEDVDLIIFGAHNEYWTQTKIEMLIKFVNQGGKLLFLGGNQAYREIIRKPSYWVIRIDNFKSDKRAFRRISNLMGTFFEGDMGTSAPFEIKNPEIWRMKYGIDVNEGDKFGDKTDFSYCSAPYKTQVGFIGASLNETDQLVKSADNFFVLAQGMQKNGGADVVYKKFDGGGEVLNFSSVGLWHSLSDTYISGLIKNFIQENSAHLH